MEVTNKQRCCLCFYFNYFLVWSNELLMVCVPISTLLTLLGVLEGGNTTTHVFNVRLSRRIPRCSSAVALASGPRDAHSRRISNAPLPIEQATATPVKLVMTPWSLASRPPASLLERYSSTHFRIFQDRLQKKTGSRQQDRVTFLRTQTPANSVRPTVILQVSQSLATFGAAHLRSNSYK